MNKSEEIRIIKNYLKMMPKTYRKRNPNWCVVRDLLMSSTSHSGRTSSINKCIELGIAPDNHEI